MSYDKLEIGHRDGRRRWPKLGRRGVAETRSEVAWWLGGRWLEIGTAETKRERGQRVSLGVPKSVGRGVGTAQGRGWRAGTKPAFPLGRRPVVAPKEEAMVVLAVGVVVAAKAL